MGPTWSPHVCPHVAHLPTYAHISHLDPIWVPYGRAGWGSESNAGFSVSCWDTSPPATCWGGGGGVKRPYVITRERMAAERRATRRSKALDETILKYPLNFQNEVTSDQDQVKGQNRGFQFTSRRDLKIISFRQNLLQILLRNRVRY